MSEETTNERIARLEEKSNNIQMELTKSMDRVELAIQQLHKDFKSLLAMMKDEQTRRNSDQDIKIERQNSRIIWLEVRAWGAILGLSALMWAFQNGFLKIPN